MDELIDHVRSLRDEFRERITPERLKVWRNGSAARAAFLDGKVLGSITWDNELGKPDTPTLADGFTIEHLEWYVEIDWGVDIVVQKGWRSSDAPITWDAPADASHHRVGFICNHTPLGDRVTVAFSPQSFWKGGSPRFGPHRIDPPVAYVAQGTTGTSLLEFFVVAPPLIENPVRVGP